MFVLISRSKAVWFPKYSALYHSYQRKRTADAIALPKILPTQAFVGNIFLTPPSSARDLQLSLCSINIANRLLRPLPGRKGDLLLQLSDLGFIDKMKDRFLTNQSIPVSKLFYKNIYNFREDLLRSPTPKTSQWPPKWQRQVRPTLIILSRKAIEFVSTVEHR